MQTQKFTQIYKIYDFILYTKYMQKYSMMILYI